MALGIWIFLIDIVASSLQVASATSIATPGLWDADLSHIHKQIVLRTEDGKPVPGITVQLAPADPLLGGVSSGTETGTGTGSQTAVTDAHGTVMFSGLGQWIWVVSFTGSFGGEALQPVGEQGRAPYGRSRNGGGFPVMIQGQEEGQEEDTPSTPLVVRGGSGTPQPEVQPSLFVLVPVQGRWAPSLDIALPEEHPLSISGAVDAQPSATPVANIAAATPLLGRDPMTSTAATTGESGFESVVRWFYILPAGVALVALYRTWQDRKQNNLQRWSREAGSDDVDHSEEQL